MRYKRRNKLSGKTVRGAVKPWPETYEKLAKAADARRWTMVTALDVAADLLLADVERSESIQPSLAGPTASTA